MRANTYDGVVSEEDVKFYAAECVLAIQSVHELGYIHRYERHGVADRVCGCRIWHTAAT